MVVIWLMREVVTYALLPVFYREFLRILIMTLFARYHIVRWCSTLSIFVLCIILIVDIIIAALISVIGHR